MKDVIGLLRDLSNANSLICKQKQAIEKMQVEIDRLKSQTEEKEREIKHLAMENEKLKNALEDSKNSGANLLIKQIVDDIVKSGLVKLEVEE
nr:MAG TPA: Transcription factor HY5 leucine zipper, TRANSCRIPTION.0A [Caudoviricetes sp.]